MTNEDGTPSGMKSLGSIGEGAGLFVLGNGTRRGLGLITNVILTRYLGTRLYGIYAFLNVVHSLLRVFTKAGGDKSVLRYLPEYENAPRKRATVLSLAYGTSLLMSLVGAAVLYWLAPWVAQFTIKDPLFVYVLRLSAVLVPIKTTEKITAHVFRGIERMDYNVAVSSVIDPLFRLICIGTAVLLGYSLIGAVVGLVAGAFLTTLVALSVLIERTNLEVIGRPTRRETSEYYRYSLPLTFNQLGNFLYNRIDLLMVGILLAGSAVGIYNVAVLVSGFLALPLKAFSQLFPPVASRLYHDGDHRELESVYGTVTRWTFTFALFPALGVFLYAGDLLLVFGEGFSRGETVLVLFAIAQLTNAAVGPSGYLLMMTDHQYLTLFNQAVSGVLNAILNYVLILQYGFVGAALATATVLTGINLLRVAEVRLLEGFFPYDWAYLKPLAAGVAAVTVMYGLMFVFQQYTLFLLGGSAGLITYVGTLYLLGIRQEETDLLKRAIG